MYNLDDIDYEILNFVLLKNKVTLEQLNKNFPENKYSTKYRVEKLSNYGYTAAKMPDGTNYLIQNVLEYKTDKYYNNIPVYSGFYLLSELGNKVIQDYNKNAGKVSKEKRKDFWLRVIPIIISVIALIFSGIALYGSYFAVPK